MGQFLNQKEIEVIQVDHTSRCNLLCPQCSRVVEGRLNPRLKLTDLNVADYKTLLSQVDLERLKSILFCGNYGDAPVSPTFLECLSYIKSLGINGITIMTNGGFQTPSYWSSLAALLHPKKDKICFSIDGLIDTNSIYRKGSRFDRIEKNVRSFIDAGGRARWDFIVFSHNEHQIDQVKETAREWGVQELLIKKTSRFIGDRNIKNDRALPLNLDQGSLSPSKSKHVSQSAAQFKEAVEEHGSWSDYLSETKIQCRSQKSKTLFVDFNMRLWPCCWVAAPAHFYYENNSQRKDFDQVMDTLPENFNSLRKKSLKEILDDDWYGNRLSQSWMEGHPDRLSTCGRTCGKVYDFSSGSSANKELIKLAEF